MKLYHGTGTETVPFTMYFAADIETAREFALGLDDLGRYHEESYIYETEINEAEVSIEEDFATFDCLAYENPALEGYGRVVLNPESGWYIVKDPVLRLVEHYRNEL